MAKELPYFKFHATEWMTGNIVYESLEVQGLFINICALYWKNLGVLSEKEIEVRFKKKSLIAYLSDRFYSVTDGFISITFLDEQLIERQKLSETNSKNGSLGGKPKVKRTVTETNRPQSETKANQSNIEEEIEGEKEVEVDNIEGVKPLPKTLEERKKEFGLSLEPFLQQYGRPMLTAFFKHWSEHNEGGKKMLFEMKKTFSLSGRLATWKSNEAKFDVKTKFNTPQTPTIKSHEFNEQ